VCSVCFAPGAKLFAAGAAECICVWNTETWTVVAELALRHAYELAFGPGAEPVLAASGAGFPGPPGAAAWDDAGRATKTGARREPDRRFPSYGGTTVVTFSPDGTQLATNTIAVTEVWRAADAQRVRTFRNEVTNSRGAVCFSPDGQRLAFAYSKWVEVWAIPDGAAPLVRFAAGTGRSPILWAVNWTADGRGLLTAGNDGCVRLWDPDTGTERKAFDWGIGKLYGAAFAPDGLTCAVCSATGQVVVWDVDL
jgi:WD40 repeat protein